MFVTAALIVVGAFVAGFWIIWVGDDIRLRQTIGLSFILAILLGSGGSLLYESKPKVEKNG